MTGIANMNRAVRAAVIGHPAGHSLSPMIHDYWRARYGLDGEYGIVDVTPLELPSAIDALRRTGFAGFNVTLPYKQVMMEYCEEVDDVARAVGAVNTVVIADGVLYGTNTDAYGFISSLRAADPELACAERPVVILGAGGAARAVAYALHDAGARRVVVCARDPDKARAFANDIAPWADAAALLDGAGLVVNTTPLGMAGQDELALDISRLPRASIVCDIVYRPLRTGLLRAGAAAGHPTVDGLGMLLHQAAGAFARWTDIVPDVTDELRALVAEAAAS